MVNNKHEKLILKIKKENGLKKYKEEYDNFKPSFIPKILGEFLVFVGNTVYGSKPSYAKLKAVEIIARIPYQSWESVSYMLQTFFYSNEKKAIELAKVSDFAKLAQDNETMHVVVISQILQKHGRENFIIHKLIPLIFSFFYFVVSWILFIVKPRYSLELNYMFEDHAFSQYTEFINRYKDKLKEKPIESEYLKFYGRKVENEYELFISIKDDEVVHRNESAKEALRLKNKN